VGTWKEHDELMVAFSRILYAWRFPEVLVDSVESHNNQMHDYFNHDPMAYHVLRSLVHSALQITKRGPTVQS
jgi:HD-like signal output (HDOD) protein